MASHRAASDPGDPYRGIAPQLDRTAPEPAEEQRPSTDNEPVGGGVRIGWRTPDGVLEIFGELTATPEWRREQQAQQRRAKEEWDVALALAKLWLALVADDPAPLAAAYTHAHAEELRRVSDALRLSRARRLPFRVLRPLRILPWWRDESSGHYILTTPTDGDGIRNLPAELRLVTQVHEHLRWLFGLGYKAAEMGLHADWLREALDHIDCAYRAFVERRYHIEKLLEGSRAGRLEGHEKNPEHKHDGKAQNLARLRFIAVELAAGISRAIPVRSGDPRVVHGILRADVLRRTQAIIDALYGVRFTEDELHELIRKRLK